MSNFDVITVGAATLDIVMQSDKFKVVKSASVPGGMALCEIYGGKMEVEDVHITSGGGATNAAVSFARKELKTACVCEMGNDPAALIIYKDLQADGVETRYLVQEQNETTAISAIMVPEGGQRSIMVYRGASAMLTEKDFPWDIETRFLYVSSLGGNLKLVKKMFSWAREKKIRVAWNPGLKEVEQSKEALSLLQYVELIFVNRQEGAKLFGNGILEESVWKDIVFPSDAHVTVVTDGVNGGRICVGNKCSTYKAIKLKQVLDTTGVGDAFASGMTAAVLYGKTYEQAVSWGLLNAKSVLGYVGAKNKLLTLAEIN